MVGTEVDAVASKGKRTKLVLTWLRVGTGGLGLSGTTYLLIEKRWFEAAAALVASCAVFLLKLLLRFVRTLGELLQSRIDHWVDSAATRAADELTRWAQELWAALFARYRSRYCRHLDYVFRTYRTQGLKTRGAFTPDLEKVYVPLRVSPSSPNQVSPDLVAKGSRPDAAQIWDFLADSREPAYRRIAVLARPGAGKTTLLEHLALTYARHTERRFHRGAPQLVPILLYLRDIGRRVIENDPPSLAVLASDQVSTRAGKSRGAAQLPGEHWFDDLLRRERSPCLVMLDGLDEVADIAERERVSCWVDRQINEYPEARFIVTSRPHGWHSAPVAEVRSVLQVEPFSLEDTRKFVANWYLENESMREQRRLDAGVRMEAERRSGALMAEIEQSPVLSELCVNPLLLTMITTVHDNQGTLPENRVALYREICEVLLIRRQKEKDLPDTLNAAKKHTLLQLLALTLMRAKTRKFTLQDASQFLETAVSEVAGNEIASGQFIKLIAEQSGLLVEREHGEYEFCHKSLQEYLAATQIKDSSQEQFLLERLEDDWWEETVRLYAAQADTSAILREALQRPSVAMLTLAYDCLREGLRASPDLQRELEATVEAGLESEDLKRSRLAAEVKLSQRLRSMVRINEQVAVDREFVSNAEYALFLNCRFSNRSAVPESWYPAHWEAGQFPRGHAHAPVTGVDAVAAATFCEWLVARTSRLAQRTTYRLPLVAEVAAYSDELSRPQSSDMAVGYWYQDGRNLLLAGISGKELRSHMTELGVPSPLPQFKSLSDIETQAIVGAEELSPLDHIDVALSCLRGTLDDPLDRNQWGSLIGAYALECALAPAAEAIVVALAIARHRDHSLARFLTRALTTILDRDQALEVDLDRDLPLAIAFARLHARARAQLVDHADRVLDPHTALAAALFNPDRARSLNQALGRARALDRELDRANSIARPRTQDGGFATQPDKTIEHLTALVTALEHSIDVADSSGFAVVLGPALALAGADIGGDGREFVRAEALANLVDARRRLANSATFPASVPVAVLAKALRASEANRLWCAESLRRGASQRGLQMYLTTELGKYRRINASAVEELSERFQKQAQGINSLRVLADLHARRREGKHPGWEGIRIVRELESNQQRS